MGTYTGARNEVVLVDKKIPLSAGWDAGFSTQSGVSKIDGELARRGLYINPGITADLEAFEILNGYSSGAGAAGAGAGIHNEGSLTFSSSHVHDNDAPVWGAGIYSSGSLNISTSVVENNQGGSGGGIYAEGTTAIIGGSITNNGKVGIGSGGGIFAYDGTVYIENSTIGWNDTWRGGGGLYSLDGDIELYRSTVAGNETTNLPSGGGISVSASGAAAIRHTIVAGNSSSLGPDCSGASPAWGTTSSETRRIASSRQPPATKPISIRSWEF